MRPDIPDFDYEYHTITVDTVGQSSAKHVHGVPQYTPS